MKIPVLKLFLLVTIINLFGIKSTMAKEYEVSKIYSNLRDMALTLDPTKIGLHPPRSNNVWGILMETGYEGAVVTLVTIADGTVSLYFSNGDGIIGIGEHKNARKAGDLFLSYAPNYLKFAKLTDNFPLPEVGYTKFYFLTYDGIYTVEERENNLGNKESPLSPFYFEAQEVISQARIYDNQMRKDFQDLMHAATTGDKSSVKILLKKGTSPNRSDKSGLTPLMAAAYRGNNEVIKLLIEHKSSIDEKDISGYTALIYASNSGHIKSAQLLINQGANVNAGDIDGSTPIMFAAQHGNNSLVKLLLKNGADPTIKGNHGLSAIGFAKQNNHKETERILHNK